MTPEAFLNSEEEQRIIAAIKQAENNTSGEIRVHLESKNKEKPSMQYVWEVFNKIGMTQTKAANGVLFYIDVKHRQLTIIADKGINEVVPSDFWKDVTKVVLNQFKNSSYADGLVEGILLVGEKLKTFFPHQTDDRNELPDEISKN